MKTTVRGFRAFVIALAGIALSPLSLSAQDARPVKVLYVYEQKNESSDLWRALFRDELGKAGYAVTEAAAGTEASAALKDADLIAIHGNVLAFTNMEPIRDWLKTGPELSGRKVRLIVTANRWFLGKYRKQLSSFISKSKASTVDAVSSATKDMKEEGRRELIRAFIATF